MRHDLAEDPVVVRIASAVGCNEDEVVGKLHRLWSWADKHKSSCDPGVRVPLDWIDRFLNCPGFCAALKKEEEWLWHVPAGRLDPHDEFIFPRWRHQPIYDPYLIAVTRRGGA